MSNLELTDPGTRTTGEQVWIGNPGPFTSGRGHFYDNWPTVTYTLDKSDNLPHTTELVKETKEATDFWLLWACPAENNPTAKGTTWEGYSYRYDSARGRKVFNGTVQPALATVAALKVTLAPE